MQLKKKAGISYAGLIIMSNRNLSVITSDVFIKFFNARFKGEGIVHPVIVPYIKRGAICVLGNLKAVVFKAEELHDLVYLRGEHAVAVDDLLGHGHLAVGKRLALDRPFGHLEVGIGHGVGAAVISVVARQHVYLFHHGSTGMGGCGCCCGAAAADMRIIDVHVDVHAAHIGIYIYRCSGDLVVMGCGFYHRNR